MVIIVVIDPDTARSSQTALTLGAFGKVYEARTKEELNSIVNRENRIDAFFVASELGPGIVRSLKEQYPAPVYVIGELPLSALGEAYAAGVEDVFPFPLNVRWIENRLDMKKAWQPSAPKQAPSATDWAAVDIPSSEPQKEMARVIVVASVKGGEGKTSFLAQLGMVLGKEGYRPLGIDADPAGNLARWIGRDTVNDISEFANEKTRVNRENLEMMLVQHQKTGFKVLPSPLRGLHPVTWEMAEAAVQAYKPYYPLMLVDLAEGYTPVFEQLAKNYATDIFLVTSTDMTRVERTREMAAKMLERGIPRDKVHVVVNKVRKESDFHVVRASLSELGFSVYPVPFHPGLAEAGEVGLAPAITDPKSAYAKAFKKVLMDELRVKIGPSGQPSAKKRSKKAGEKRKSGFSLERWFPRFLTRKRGEEV